MSSIVSKALAKPSAWGKPVVYYSHALDAGTFTTTSDTTAYPIESIYDPYESTLYKSTETSPVIVFDAGAGNTLTADYFAISGHNLNRVSTVPELKTSPDGVTYGSDLLSASIPSADNLPNVWTFTSVSARFWKLTLVQSSPTRDLYPYLVNAIWGQKLELDYSSVAFDPNESEYDDTVNLSETGVVLGIYKNKRVRRYRFKTDAIEPELYDSIRAWRDSVGLAPFFVNWDPEAHPTECYYMRFESMNWSAPYVIAGDSVRNVSFDLVGRVSGWQ